MAPPDSIPVDEKRQALERLLASRTFSRSEQLRAFLRYVCEAEFEGRAHQINEYALGVSVLGRPAHYSPAEDSSVRSRAYELRNKLRSYYASEFTDDPIQIEIDKGAYVPRFVRRGEGKAPVAEEAAAASADASATNRSRLAPAASVPKPRRIGLLLVLASALASALAGFFVSNRRHDASAGQQPDAMAARDLEALWKPFLESDAPLLIVFETRLFFFAPATGLVVRDYRTNEPAQAAQSKPLLAFQDRMGAEELQPRLDYAEFGAVHAAFLLGRLIRREVGVKHSSSLGWQDIWNSNIIFIGRPNLNPTIRYELPVNDFVVSEHGWAIHNLHPLPGEPDVYRMTETHGEGEKYGLITVLPGPQPGHHMMILNSSESEVNWALGEAVTSPPLVHEIMSHVLGPSREAPATFQVVISAMFESYVPVKISYVTHRVHRTP